eukprot:10671456-Ditylum_brightwellii.AAC.1
MGNPIPFEHFGVRCILIHKPKIDRAFKELLTQYKLTVKDLCSMWTGICTGNLKMKITRQDFQAVIKVDNIAAFVYRFKASTDKAFLDVFTDNPLKVATRLASHIPTLFFEGGGYKILGQIGK